MFSSPAALFGSLLFGAIGLGALMYGKKMVLYKPMIIGFVLMAYPYFVPLPWLMYAIGSACLGAVSRPRLRSSPSTTSPKAPVIPKSDGHPDSKKPRPKARLSA